MYYKIEQLKNILANHKNCVFSLDHLCSSALEYIQHLEAGIDRCYELAKQVESAQPKWISVEEKLPEESVEVLMLFKHNMAAGWYGGEGDWYSNTDDGFYASCDGEPTHWMPLPEPPKEDDNANA